MKKLTRDFKMKSDAVYFVPLGGCGMFGSNMTLYGYRGKWIMVDCGMGFADDTMPGVDILLPDPSFAASLGDDLLGIIITHAHEDHLGAVQHLWPRLKAPLYATRLAALRLKQDFNETPWGGQAKLHEIPPRGKIELEDFSIEMIKMAHSIPESRAIAITAGDAGTILHTGDWKIDPDPVEGDVTDEKALIALGEKGVLAVVGDSTNAMVPGHSGSERTIEGNFAEIFSEFKRKIVVTCFSTSVPRLHTVYKAAKQNGRQVCLVGRSLWQMDEAARQAGYLKDIPRFLDMDEAEMLAGQHLVFVCTGSQGEPRAALTRISNDEHPRLSVDGGDAVIFSSRIIPGSERRIDRMKNRFLLRGASVLTIHEAPVHVSGHPCRDELKQLYAWTKPKIAIPVHGEHMQLEKHADLAHECGVPQTVVPANGQVYELTNGAATRIGVVDHGMLAIEGKRIVAVDHEAILARRRIMWNGSAVVTIVVDAGGGLVAPPKVTALGLLDESSELDTEYMQEAVRRISQAIQNMPKEKRRDDEALSESVRITARRFFQERFDRKPQTRVHLVRV